MCYQERWQDNFMVVHITSMQNDPHYLGPWDSKQMNTIACAPGKII
jgi:hypothetical protein